MCILIGAFLVNIVDMILPKGKLKPYINLVSNLIFVFIVISPIVGYISNEKSLEDTILKSMTEYNKKYIEASKEISSEDSNLSQAYEENLKEVIQLKLNEYGYKIEDLDFNGTDIENLKIKKIKEDNLFIEKDDKDNQSEKEVFKNNTIYKEDKENLKDDLIKILEVSIDKIEID